MMPLCAAHTCVHCTHIGSNTWGPMHNSMHTHVALNFYFGILQPANSVKYCRFVIELNSFFFVVSAPCLCVMLSNWDWGEIRSTQRNLECKTTQTNTFQISTHLIFTQDFILLRSLLQPCVLMLTSFSSFSSIFLCHLFFPIFSLPIRIRTTIIQWKRIIILVHPFDWEDGTKDACVQIVTPSNRSSRTKKTFCLQQQWMYRTSIWMHKNKMQHHTHTHKIVLILNGAREKEREKSHKSYWLCSFSLSLSFFSLEVYVTQRKWQTHSHSHRCECACVRFVSTVKKCIMKKNNNPNEYGITRTRNKWGEKKS